MSIEYNQTCVNKIKNIQYYISLFFERMISIMIPRFLIISFIIYNIYKIDKKTGLYLIIIFLIVQLNHQIHQF